MKKPKRRRQKGTGRIFQRERGGSYYLSVRIKGKPITLSLGTKNLDDAEVEADKKLTIINSQSIDELEVKIKQIKFNRKKTILRLDDVWNQFLKSQNRPDTGPSTLVNYERDWKKFVSWLKSNYPAIAYLSEVNDEIALEYAQHLWESGISSATFNYHIYVNGLVFRVLLKLLGISDNPFSAVVRKKSLPQVKKELSEVEIVKLLKSFDDPKMEIMHKSEMKLLFCIGAYTGLRLVDCAQLKWEGVDFNNREISLMPVKTGRKTRKYVHIHLNDSLFDLLKSASKEKAKDAIYVIPKVAERYSSNPSGVRSDCVQVFKDNGYETTVKVENVQRKLKANVYGFHSLRHTLASISARGKVSQQAIQDVLGHSSSSMTRHYTHSDKASLSAVTDAMPSMSNRKKPTLLETMKVSLGEKMKLSPNEKKAYNYLKKLLKKKH